MDEEVRKPYRQVLAEALKSGIIEIPRDILYEYEEKKDVYRVVKYTDEKTSITDEDFRAQAEIEAITRRSDYNPYDVRNYGCSFFMDEQMVDFIMHLPRKNKKKAKGLINQTFGPTTIEDENSHFMCFLFADAKLEEVFEVI